MKKNRLLLLFVAVMLGVLSACGTPPTSTPTPVVPTDVPTDTEVPTTIDMTPTMEMMETETPTAMAATGDTATPTPTGVAGTVPVQLVCWFCIQQVPHVMVAMPQSATFTVASSSSVSCNSVETLGDQQLVLCKGPKQSGSVSFDLNVCSNGNCADRHLAAVDCSATAVPTNTPTVTPTTTGTVTPAGSVATRTPTVGAGASATSTRVLEVIITSTATTVSTATPTP